MKRPVLSSTVGAADERMLDRSRRSWIAIVSLRRRSDAKADRLRAHPFLRSLPERDIRRLAMYADPVWLPTGVVLTEAGRLTKHFYLFDDGTLLCETGVHRAGCLAIGFHECLTGRPASATVVVGDRCSGYVVDGRCASWLRVRLGTTRWRS